MQNRECEHYAHYEYGQSTTLPMPAYLYTDILTMLECLRICCQSNNSFPRTRNIQKCSRQLWLLSTRISHASWHRLALEGRALEQLMLITTRWNCWIQRNLWTKLLRWSFWFDTTPAYTHFDVNGWMDGWMDRWMVVHEQANGWMHRWMDGWMDG